MRKWKRTIACLTAAVLVCSASGCKKEQKVVMNDTGEIPEKLTIFSPLGGWSTKAGASTNNDKLVFQLMEEKTGCHVEWVHPANGANDEKFNLLIASGELPDMIVHAWNAVEGGAEMFVEDEVIIPLTELIDENMPNLKAYLEENPEIKKQFTFDNGEIYYIPFIRKDPQLKIYEGPQIRQDWLDKLGLQMPTNSEELYNVLKAFKTQDPNGNGEADEIPMSGVKFENVQFGIGNLLWQFGTMDGLYIKDGKVTYGLLEEEYEEGLKYIAKLYKEGLIDTDYLLNDRDKMDNKFMNDKVGFIYSLQPTNFYANMNDGVRKVVGTPHFRNEGVKNNTFDPGYKKDVTNISIAVTTANPNPSGSMKWLDEFFGGEGYEYMNFGKEGLTFNWEDGYPKLTDYVLNPEERSSQEMCALNLGAYESSFPALQDWRYYEQTLSPWGRESIDVWSKSATIDGIIPSLTFTAEENDEIAQKYSQILTYVSENVNKIVVGKNDISEIDNIRRSVKSMGIDDIIKIYNDALKRYNNR